MAARCCSQVPLPTSNVSEHPANAVLAKENGMPRLETLSEINRQAMRSFPCLEPDMTPWSPLHKPLSQSKISLVTSAGLHLRDDKPFIGDPKGGDTSYRIIPSTAKAADILQSHVSIGFDHTAIMRDLNVTLPMDRVRELVDKGIIGSLAENYYSFMGALRNPKPLIEATGPEVANRLKDEGVDLVFITPT
jgi:D-proline reductase (dithiol) PrdB